jgi:hypothetical protein
MPARTTALLIAAGALASAAFAWTGTAEAQLPILTTTTTAAPTTTTTTAAPTTTTTAGAAETTTTTTAATTTSTTAQSQANNGSLSIAVPASSSLASAPNTASTLSAHLGAVTVSDSRGALAGGWSVTVTSSDFTTGSGTAAETIGKTRVAYWSGPATNVSGLGTPLPGQLTSSARVSLGSSRPAFGGTGAVGTTSISWDPTLVVSLSPSTVVGQYQGTITHSVA